MKKNFEQKCREQQEEVQKKFSEINALFKKEDDARLKNKRLEAHIWQKFRKLVKNKVYFSISDVEALGLEYDVLFVLGKKNIGKTTQIYKLFENALKNDEEQVVYGRISATELNEAEWQFADSPKCPVILKKRKGKWFIFDKQSSLIKGRAVDFKFCQAIGGGEFTGVKSIIFDEVITHDPRNTFNEKHLRNWSAFISSVVRNKKGVKVYLFGNMVADNNQILDYYGISREDNLRYITRGAHKDNECRILFINTRELYLGIGGQDRAVHQANPKFAQFLLDNSIVQNYAKIIDATDFYECAFKFAFAIEIPKQLLICEVREIQVEDTSNIGWSSPDDKMTYFVLKMHLYAPYIHLDGEIYTDNSLIAHTRMNIEFKNDLNFEKYFLINSIKNGTLFFYDSMSITVLEYFKKMHLSVLEENIL